MARSKPKKYSKMNYWQKNQWENDQMEKYGITPKQERGMSGRGGQDREANMAAINAAMRNDYDYRRSAESGQLKDITGDGSAEDFVNYQRAASKFHKKEQGNGGSWSSTKDFAGTTTALVQDQARELQEENDKRYDAKYASAAKLNELQDSIQKRAEETGPTEISSTLTNAQREVGEYDEDKTSQGANIFGAMGPSNDLELARAEVQTNEASGDGQDRDNAEAYKDGYALNVKGGLELSGIETRGPDSGLMRDGSGFG